MLAYSPQHLLQNTQDHSDSECQKYNKIKKGFISIYNKTIQLN